MPVTFNKDGNNKKMIYTKITGVKGSCEEVLLNDKAGNSWKLEHKLVTGPEHKNTMHMTRGGKVVLLINNIPYEKSTMGKSMFSVIDYASHLMISRQKILRYMFLFPERVVNVFRKPGILSNLETQIQAKIEINNYDDSVFELTCTLGEMDIDEYHKELSGPHKLNEWMITGIDANRLNPMISLGCNIGIELFDKVN